MKVNNKVSVPVARPVEIALGNSFKTITLNDTKELFPKMMYVPRQGRIHAYSTLIMEPQLVFTFFYLYSIGI